MQMLLNPLTGQPKRGRDGSLYGVDASGRVWPLRPFGFIDSHGRAIPVIKGAAASALIFCDSFDHYANITLMQRKWTQVPGGGAIVAGRNGNGFQGGATSSPSLTFGPTFTKLCCGTAYNTQSFSNWISVFNDIVSGGLVGLHHVGDGRVFVASNFGNQSPFSTFTMLQNQWYYFELQVTSSPPNVLYEVRANGGTILSGSFLGGALNFNQLLMILPGGGLTAIIDDLYVTDGEFLGDVNIACLYPNAAGDNSAWTPFVAGANYLQVKEHSPDDFTTYNSSSAINQQDLYNLDNITGFFGTIKGAQALWCVARSAAGVGSVKGALKSGTTTIFDSEYFPSDVSWLYERAPYRTSPFTTLDWTVPEINALQQGIKRIT